MCLRLTACTVPLPLTLSTPANMLCVKSPWPSVPLKLRKCWMQHAGTTANSLSDIRTVSVRILSISKKEAADGTFGEIYYAKATAIRRRAVPTWGVFLNEFEQGGGPLIDIGTHALDLTLWIMDNYKPKYCLGTTFHKLNGLSAENQGNAWGTWEPAKFTVEDSAFGFVVMENGATIVLESAWALNSLDVREAVTTVCGTVAGGDMEGGVRINGIRNGRQYILKPDLSAGGAAFYEGDGSEEAHQREARLWIDAIINNKTPFVLPEQAYCVTQILEGIYESAKTGTVYNF